MKKNKSYCNWSYSIYGRKKESYDKAETYAKTIKDELVKKRCK